MARKKRSSTGARMGGKEERVSQVGRARAQGRREPSTDELLHGEKGSRGAGPYTARSRRPRGGTSGLEPEVRA